MPWFFFIQMETKILEFSKFIDHLNLGYELVIASRMIKGGYNEDDNSILSSENGLIWVLPSLLIRLWQS